MKKCIRGCQYLLHTVFLVSIVLTGVFFYVLGSQPQMISGFVDQAQQTVNIKGKVIHKNVPTTQEKEEVQVTYTNNENFESFEALRESARSSKGEILRGFVAMPATPSTKQIYLPIYEGVSKHVLAIGAGVGAENRRMGKGLFPIFAHNMGNGTSWNPSYFSTLQTANDSVLHMPVYVTNGDILYTYQIQQLDRYVPNHQGSILDEKPDMNPQLLLITCQEDANFWDTYYRTGRTYAPYRIVLNANLIESMPFKKADKTVQALFPDLVHQVTQADQQIVKSQETTTSIQEIQEPDRKEVRTIAVPKVKIQQSQNIMFLNQYGYYLLVGWYVVLLMLEALLWIILKKLIKRQEENTCRLRKVR